jgi:hypothetical protein
MIRLRNKTYTCPVDVTLSFIGGKEFAPLYKFASKWGINYLQANGIEYVQDQHLYK